MKQIKTIVCLIPLLCLTACAKRFESDTTYVKKSHEIPAVVVPSSVPPIKKNDYYAIPPVTPSATSNNRSLIPPTL